MEELDEIDCNPNLALIAAGRDETSLCESRKPALAHHQASVWRRGLWDRPLLHRLAEPATMTPSHVILNHTE